MNPPTLAPCTICSLPAAWRCSACGDKCADHVRRWPGARLRFRCEACTADTELLRVPRASLVPLKSLVGPALRTPFRGRVALAWLLATVVFLPEVAVPYFGWLLGGCVAIVLALRLLAARGDDIDFDWPDVSDPLEDVVMPLACALLANAPVIVVAFALVARGDVRAWHLEATHAHSLEITLLRSPGLWASLVFAALWVPFATLWSLLAPSAGASANAWEWVRIARRYRHAYGLATLLGGGGLIAATVFALLTPRGWIGGFVASAFVAWVVLATAAFLGDFLNLHASELGWGRADESFVDLGSPDAPAVYAPPAPPPAPKPVEAPTPLDVRLAAALDAKDAHLSLALYQESPESDSILPATLLIRVGQAAASLGQYSPAIQALTAAGRQPGEDGAKALVIAARILEERMRDLEGAKRLYQQAVERFAGTQGAAYAAKQLADHRFVSVNRVG